MFSILMMPWMFWIMGFCGLPFIGKQWLTLVMPMPLWWLPKRKAGSILLWSYGSMMLPITSAAWISVTDHRQEFELSSVSCQSDVISKSKTGLSECWWNYGHSWSSNYAKQHVKTIDRPLAAHKGWYQANFCFWDFCIIDESSVLVLQGDNLSRFENSAHF